MKAFIALPPFEISVLETLALFYMPARTSTLVDVLRAQGLRDGQGRLPDVERLRTVLGRLKAVGFVRNSGVNWICERSVVERITRNMVAAGRFEAAAPQVQTALRRTGGWGAQGK